MVKLQKRFSYKYKDKNHYKHLVTIPDEILNQLNWKEGIELEPIILNDKLLLQIKKN